MFSSGSSNYFFNRAPSTFGGQQKDYLQRVESIVSSVVERLHAAVESKQNLDALFHELLDFLGASRHAIAVAHRTENAEHHGRRRNLNPSSSGIMYTSLSDIYTDHNTYMLPVIQSYLRDMPHTLKSFQSTEKKIDTGTCLGRKTSFEITIFSQENQDKWNIEYSRAEYERLCRVSSVTPLDSSHSLQECIQHLMTQEVLGEIKKTSIEDYKKLKFKYVLQDLVCHARFPGKKSDWVLMTARCEINGKMYALSQYLTWMYRTLKDDPVQYMTTRPDPTIMTMIHQDVFLNPDTLQEIARLFQEAIQWHGDDIQELMNTIGLINYLFAHAMPFERGSAAICEWLEMSIYRYHGFDMQYHQAFSVNMEALVLPLPEFIKKYPSMVKIEQLPSKTLGTTP